MPIKYSNVCRRGKNYGERARQVADPPVTYKNAVYARSGKQEGNSRRIRRHRTLNRNANVLTKSEILRNAARRRTSSTCPENLRPVTEFSSWNIHPAYLRPVHITLASPLPSPLPLFLFLTHSLASLIILFSRLCLLVAHAAPNSTGNLADPLFPRFPFKFSGSFRAPDCWNFIARNSTSLLRRYILFYLNFVYGGSNSKREIFESYSNSAFHGIRCFEEFIIERVRTIFQETP